MDAKNFEKWLRGEECDGGECVATMDAEKFEKWLIEKNACKNGLDFARGKSMQETWNKLERSEWMMWLYGRRNVEDKKCVMVAIFAAELCLENFELAYPDDNRPREAIRAAKMALKKHPPLSESAARSVAWSAVWSSAWSAAWSAEESSAWSAAWSAACAANAVWSAACAANAARDAASAAVESAAWSARSAMASAERARSAAQKQICDYIRKIITLE